VQLMTSRAVVWFRRDLRLADNPAWAAASERVDRVTALFVLDPSLYAAAGPARRHQLLAHLYGLDQSLQSQGGRLLVFQGDPTDVVPQVVRAYGAVAVYANADVTPYARQRDLAVRSRLDVDLQLWWGTLMHPPGSVTTEKGHTSRVFTPFHVKWRVQAPPKWPEARHVEIDDENGDGLPRLEQQAFQAGGEVAAMNRLIAFAERVDDYEDNRDRPDLAGTSCLSADLHFGTLAPRTIAWLIGTSTKGRATFVRQLAWRDWYAHLLWEVPSLVDAPLRPDTMRMEWKDDPDDIERWQTGLTGYPLIDAGMRQLEITGWMHNRVRMAVASFLVKDLLVDWRIGERWFRERLVDGDIAQNVGNWQWVAGTGPDAAPYFRVFNPVLQSRKFDPDGNYIKRFIPELSDLPVRWIHAPWTAPPEELAPSGVRLGDSYPLPMIDHAFARDRALAAYAAARQAPMK
jgi:deoxyribodipyrimidine photo-lyase